MNPINMDVISSLVSSIIYYSLASYQDSWSGNCFRQCTSSPISYLNNTFSICFACGNDATQDNRAWCFVLPLSANPISMSRVITFLYHPTLTPLYLSVLFNKKFQYMRYFQGIKLSINKQIQPKPHFQKYFQISTLTECCPYL